MGQQQQHRQLAYLMRFVRPFQPGLEVDVAQHDAQRQGASGHGVHNAVDDLIHVAFHRLQAGVDEALLRLAVQAVSPANTTTEKQLSDDDDDVDAALLQLPGQAVSPGNTTHRDTAQ